MAVNSVLSSRIVGKIINSGEKIICKDGLEILAPAKAVKYDVLTGSGKKGEFQQYIFRSKKDKPVQILTKYDNNGEVKYVVTDYTRKNGVLDITRRTTVNGDVTTQYASILPQQMPDGEIIFSKSFMTSSPKGDKGGLELLQKGKKPIGLSYKYNYDGTPTAIEYKNTQGQKLDITETESRYLPFVPRRYVIVEQNGQLALGSADFTREGAQKKINLAQIIQEKLHSIEGILPRAKSVEAKDLHLIKTSGMTPEEYFAEKGFMIKGEHLGNGQINIVTNIDNNSDGVVILDFLSHEMQHASDTIKMYRGGAEATDEALKKVGKTLEEWNQANESEFKDLNMEEYMKKVIDKKGKALKGTPEYDESVKLYEMNFRTTAVKDQTSASAHDRLPLEQRAIEREKQQLEFYTQICQKITNFLTTFLGQK